jgi:hypothetical protein
MPFTTDEFFDTFRRYNEAVWPLQIILVAAGLAVVLLALSPRRNAGRLGMLVVATLWLWMGGVYHFAFFRQINPAAAGFAVLFVVQGGAFAWLGARKDYVTFRPRRGIAGTGGALLIVYALALYPVIGLLAGHRFPAMPTFGVPCPTTIFTLGVLLWAERPVPGALVVIPALWAVIGTVGALQLGVPEDVGLTIAALIAIPAILFARGRDTRTREALTGFRPKSGSTGDTETFTGLHRGPQPQERW